MSEAGKRDRDAIIATLHEAMQLKSVGGDGDSILLTTTAPSGRPVYIRVWATADWANPAGTLDEDRILFGEQA